MMMCAWLSTAFTLGALMGVTFYHVLAVPR